MRTIQIQLFELCSFVRFVPMSLSFRAAVTVSALNVRSVDIEKNLLTTLTAYRPSTHASITNRCECRSVSQTCVFDIFVFCFIIRSSFNNFFLLPFSQEKTPTVNRNLVAARSPCLKGNPKGSKLSTQLSGLMKF